MVGIFVVCALLTLAMTIFGFWQPSTEIAYICDRAGNYTQICLTDADRGVEVLLTHDPDRYADNVAWSPDGRQIAFDGQTYLGADATHTAMFERGLYLLDVAGGQPRLLMPDAYEPDWSPDGTQIAFSQKSSQPNDYGWSLYAMPPNGSPHLIFTDSLENYNPVWSPDGTRIAFQTRTSNPYHSDIYIVNADGSDPRQITPGDSIYFDPAWSPDGTKLAYFWAGDWDRDILVRDLATGATQNLTAAFSGLRGYDGSPVWSPDGSRLAFDSDVGHYGIWEIYIMKSDGSGVYPVAAGERPAWRPPRTLSWADLWR